MLSVFLCSFCEGFLLVLLVYVPCTLVYPNIYILIFTYQKKKLIVLIGLIG